MKKPLILLFLLFLLGISLSSCNEVDLKLVNQIKTFGPKWATVGGDFIYIDRNLSQMENRFAKDFDEVKPLLGQVADSLRSGTYYRDINAYKVMILDLDTLRITYDENKKIYSNAVLSFNEWEKKVMKGEIAQGIADSDLTKFKQTRNDLNKVTDRMKKDLAKKVVLHNRVMRSITDKLGIYTNYDIELK